MHNYSFHTGTRVSMPTRVSVITSMMVQSTVMPDTGTTMETTTGVPATAAFPVLAAAVGGGGGAFIAIMLALIVVIVVVFVVRRRGRGKIRTVDSEQEMHNPVYSGTPQTQVCLYHMHIVTSAVCVLYMHSGWSTELIIDGSFATWVSIRGACLTPKEFSHLPNHLRPTTIWNTRCLSTARKYLSCPWITKFSM